MTRTLALLAALAVAPAFAAAPAGDAPVETKTEAVKSTVKPAVKTKAKVNHGKTATPAPVKGRHGVRK
jgi:hypothetical protein